MGGLLFLEGESVLGGFFVDLFGGIEVDAYGCFIFRHFYNIMGIITEIIILIAPIAAASLHYRVVTAPNIFNISCIGAEYLIIGCDRIL